MQHYYIAILPGLPTILAVANLAIPAIIAFLGRIFLHQLSSHLESHLNCYFF
jgi:hypothetical protein